METFQKQIQAPTLGAMLYLSGTIDEIRKKSDECIDAGISRLCFPDHLIGGGNAQTSSTKPWLSMWPTLIDIAIRHPNATVGTLVASPWLRPAAQLCVDAATVAHIVGENRFILSVGSGGAKSDVEILGNNPSKSELVDNFDEYICELDSLLNGEKLRLAQKFKIRLASDSVDSISTVAKYGSSWVTTGGWKKPLEQRISRINLLANHLTDLGFEGNIALSIDKDDGISINSSEDELIACANQYDCVVDEIIIPY